MSLSSFSSSSFTSSSSSYSSTILVRMRKFLKCLIYVIVITHVQAHSIHNGGSCGSHAIPYQISVTDDGLKLSCAPTLCVLSDTNDDISLRYHRRREEVTVKCESYQDTVCSGDLEWTGGLMEVNNGTHTTLKTECCTYPGMYRSYLIRTVLLGKDDRYEGGIIEMSDNSTSFDLIKAVRKAINSDNRMQYVVTIHRIPCTTDPTHNKHHALKILSRNKRRLNVNKKKGDNYDYVVEVVRNRRVHEDYVHPAIRKRPPIYRRRQITRVYDDNSDDYDYDFYIPRIIRTHLRKNHRLWPFAQMRSDGGVYNPRKVIEIKGDPHVLVESGSNNMDYTALPDSRKEVTPISTNILHGPLPQNPTPPRDYHVLTQYIPAYKEASYYLPNSSPRPTLQRYSYIPPLQKQVPLQPAPSAQQYYYISSSPYRYTPSLNNVFDQMQCFSGDMKDYGESLKLTANHLLYVANCNRGTPLRLIAAKNAQVDQCILVTGNRSKLIQRRISSIAKVTERGIYAPLTATGDIVVNRYLVSCHSNIALKTLQQTFFGFYQSVSMVLRYFPHNHTRKDTYLPLGVHYMTTILDLFLPSSFL
ncbi:hypothetical protein Angca_004456 [Angiostrongylus cantonensis]|nr:hypothetical protein Angca_004456 [Angiostrongylus cantonensis]